MLVKLGSQHNDVTPPSLIAAAASLLALLHLIGKWDFSRLLGGTSSLLTEPRLWFVVALIGLRIVYEQTYGSVGVQAARPNPLNDALLHPLILLTVFVIYMVSTAFWSADATLAMLKAYDYVFMLAVIWLYFFWNSEADVSLWFWIAVLITGSALAVIALSGISPGSSPNPDRLSTLGGGPNIFGRTMGLVALFSLYQALRSRQVVIWSALSMFMMFMVVMTGSRGAFIATLCGAAVMVAIELRRDRTCLGRLLQLGAIGVAGIAVSLLSPYGSRVMRFLGGRLIEATLFEGYTAGRNLLYEKSLELIQQNPIFGIGLESFYAQGIGRYPHNLILEILVEGGFVGGFLFVVTGIAFAMAFWKHRHRINSCGIAALVQALIAAQVSGDIYDNRGIILFAFLAMSAPLRESQAPGQADVQEPARYHP